MKRKTIVELGRNFKEKEKILRKRLNKPLLLKSKTTKTKGSSPKVNIKKGIEGFLKKY